MYTESNNENIYFDKIFIDFVELGIETIILRIWNRSNSSITEYRQYFFVSFLSIEYLI